MQKPKKGKNPNMKGFSKGKGKQGVGRGPGQGILDARKVVAKSPKSPIAINLGKSGR